MTLNDKAVNNQQNPTVIDKVKQIVGAGTPSDAHTPDPSAVQFKRVHIIVNPASGQTGINLPALNKVLKDLNIDWEMFVTRRGGEASERAQQAIAAGVDAIVVYGGDGTVLEVAAS